MDLYEFLSIIIVQIILQVFLTLKSNATISSGFKRLATSHNNGSNDQLALSLYALVDQITNIAVRGSVREANTRPPSEEEITISRRSSKEKEEERKEK